MNRCDNSIFSPRQYSDPRMTRGLIRNIYRPLSEASKGYVFTLYVCPQGGVLSHNALGVLEPPPPPPPKKF